jgi:monoamine oxidase
MPRTRPFALVARALARARRAQGSLTLPRALTRRHALLLGAASTLAACVSTKERGAGASAAAEPTIIIGGGTAGLVAAYRLMKAGRSVALYEASNRFGGRMFTQRNFTPEGLFCELGGELVDTGHKELIALATELGLGIQRLALEDAPDEDIYDIGGRLYRAADFLDPETGEGAFAPLAARIAEDQEKLLDADENWTDHARALDGTSLKDYLETLRPLTKPWAMQAIALAYHAEYGIPLDRQSALNLVDFIGVETEEEFALFGDSDELFRIEGGSSALPEALLKAIESKVDLRKGHALSALSFAGDMLKFTFDGPAGARVEASAQRAILALPFTRLREVQGVDALGLSEIKLKAIRELGYGDNAKIMTATTARPWKTQTARGFSFTGAVYSDRGFGIVWDASRGQAGTGGVLTNFMLSTPAEGEVKAREALLDDGLKALNPKVAAALDKERRAVMLWGRHPQVKGSYAGPLIGQYTTLVEAGAPPELDGRLHFAGEHTSASSMGFMNGAVESGERAAKEILAG